MNETRIPPTPLVKESVAEFDSTPGPSPMGRGERGKLGDFATFGGKIPPHNIAPVFFN
jgi:hypothetical protein